MLLDFPKSGGTLSSNTALYLVRFPNCHEQFCFALLLSLVKVKTSRSKHPGSSFGPAGLDAVVDDALALDAGGLHNSHGGAGGVAVVRR